MKTLFTIVFLALVAASFLTWWSLPGQTSAAPILYWVTDGSSVRLQQIRAFKEWLKKNNLPDIDVRLDTVNNRPEKVLVQGVSGVCGEILDHTGGSNMRFRQAVGLLEDLTDDAERMGFGLSRTFPALRDELSVDGRQYAFPGNAGTDGLWVNVEAFEAAGMDVPPRQWTVEAFEAVGREFVSRMNEPGRPRRYYFTPDISAANLARTMGAAFYNETQTACVVDTPGFRRALGLRYKWTHEDHLLPTTADLSAFADMPGYGGLTYTLFTKGHFAVLNSGRWAVMLFRHITDERRKEGLPPMRLSVSEPPNGGLRVQTCYTRAIALYAAGKNKALAKHFMAFLASDEYNMGVVLDGDAQPPLPEYSKTPEYLRPADHPEEWQTPWGSVHGAFAEMMDELAVSPEFSPFVLDAVANRLFGECADKHMNNMLGLNETTALIQRLVNDEILRALGEDPAMRALYNERLATQAKIETLRARNEKIPLSWITNPYWRRHHALRGLIDEAR